MSVVDYRVSDRMASITLNRPERGNGINRELMTELERCVERADLDPEVRVLLLAGNGKGFCGGYDLVESAEGQGSLGRAATPEPPPRSPLDPRVMTANHDPIQIWDPMIDYAMMSRNVKAFMSLFHCGKPVVCKVHGFCGAGGTDLALCSDLLVIARLPTRARLGIALVTRIARMPLNQLQMMKLLVNQGLYAQGLHSTQTLGTVLDGLARHTGEGYAFQGLAAREGFRAAVKACDEPFGDAATFKG